MPERPARQQRLLEGEGLPRITELTRAVEEARQRIKETYDETIDIGFGPAAACWAATI